MATRAIEAGRAFMRLSINDEAFRSGLQRVEARLKKAGQAITNVGARLGAFGAALGAPLLAAVKAASDAQETFSKFEVVFGAQADAVRQWGDTLAEQVGRSRTEVAGFVAGFQDLLVPIGIDPATAEESSKILTQLAFDLASFNNMADADTIRDLQAALTGSGEVMKKYGVIVSEAAVKQQLLNDGIDPKTATEQQKVFARLAIILAGTTAAQGDAIRTADGFANSLKGLQGAARDAAAEVGAALLPAATKVVQTVRGAAEAVRSWATANSGAIQTLAGVAAGAVGLGGALVGLGASVQGVAFAIGGLRTALLALRVAFVTSPLGVYAAALGVVAAAIAIIARNAGTAKRRLDELKKSAAVADESQTTGDAATIASQADRFNQLAQKTNRTAAETRELIDLLVKLRTEYRSIGRAQTENDNGTDNVTNAEELAARLAVARSQQSEASVQKAILLQEMLIERLQKQGAEQVEITAAQEKLNTLKEREAAIAAAVRNAEPPAPIELPDPSAAVEKAEEAGKKAGESFAGSMFDRLTAGITGAVNQAVAVVQSGADKIGEGIAFADDLADRFAEDQRNFAASLRNAQTQLRLGEFGGRNLASQASPRLINAGEQTVAKLGELVGVQKEALDALRRTGLMGV